MTTLTSLPDAVPLKAEYDAQRLRNEVSVFLTGNEPKLSAIRGRRVLTLRGRAGTQYISGWTHPAPGEFRDTPFLRQAPYLADVVADLPVPVRAVRLVAQAPGTSRQRQVPKCGPPWGFCRLQLPIVSGRRRATEFAGNQVRMTDGTLWFGSFWRPHLTVNDESYEGVDLIIDVHHSPRLVDLFPEQVQHRLREPYALPRRPEVPLPADGPLGDGLTFELPDAFVNWETTGRQLHDTCRETSTAVLSVDAGRVRLTVCGRRTYGLEHVGQDEFRVSGWSDERTLQVLAPTASGAHCVVLRVRRGRYERALHVPAMPHSTSG